MKDGFVLLQINSCEWIENTREISEWVPAHSFAERHSAENAGLLFVVSFKTNTYLLSTQSVMSFLNSLRQATTMSIIQRIFKRAWLSSVW